MKKIKNEKAEKKYTCSVYGKSYLEKARKFTLSHSPIYKENGRLLAICRDCVFNIYEKYSKKFSGDEYNAIKRVCMLLDIYFCNTLFDKSEKVDPFTNRTSSYLSKINLLTYM